MNKMGKVVILDDVCKGCYLCAGACPKKVLAPAKDKLNKKGYRPIEAVNPDDCIGCAMCATMCPDCAIEVYK